MLALERYCLIPSSVSFADADITDQCLRHPTLSAAQHVLLAFGTHDGDD